MPVTIKGFQMRKDDFHKKKKLFDIWKLANSQYKKYEIKENILCNNIATNLYIYIYRISLRASTILKKSF